jgi:hypothetical protein
VDTEVLVEERIEHGRQLLVDLIQNDFDVDVALWVHTVEDDLWLLYIGSATLQDTQIGDAYGKIYGSLSKVKGMVIPVSDIKLILPSNPIAVAATMYRNRHNSRTAIRFSGNRIGGLAVQEAYVYPYLPEADFKGFENLRKQFPSAEIFTLRVPIRMVSLPDLAQLMGRINTAEFEGKAPESVWFAGPAGSSANRFGKLIFIYRPEGWNKLFRADTNSWEEVVHVGSGKKLYESADFSPLAALKADEAPSAWAINRIKKALDEGAYLTIPPDTTPIHGIPYTPPATPGEDPPETIDWEQMQNLMEAGGNVVVHGWPKQIQPTTPD